MEKVKQILQRKKEKFLPTLSEEPKDYYNSLDLRIPRPQLLWDRLFPNKMIYVLIFCIITGI